MTTILKKRFLMLTSSLRIAVFSRNETTMFFLTPPCHTPSVGVIGFNVKVDGVPLKSVGVMQFTYMDDPLVTIIDPNLALKRFSSPLYRFLRLFCNSITPTLILYSGGNIVGIRGVNLKNVQHPQFIVYIGNENRTSVSLCRLFHFHFESPTSGLLSLFITICCLSFPGLQARWIEHLHGVSHAEPHRLEGEAADDTRVWSRDGRGGRPAEARMEPFQDHPLQF